MISSDKIGKIKASKKMYHSYIEDNYFYMLRPGDYENEIEKTKKLHSLGVNFAGPVSQLKLDNGYVIVEEYLAKGNCIGKFENDFYFHSISNAENVMHEFIQRFIPYFEEIKLRANAPQALYDKLFDDIIEMNKENLTIDTCSTGNLFFDESIGFSIIDAYPFSPRLDINQLLHLIIGDLYRLICIDNQQFIDNCVPQMLYNEFKSCIETIITKYKEAVKKHHFNFNFNSLNLNLNAITEDLIKELSNLEKSGSIVI